MRGNTQTFEPDARVKSGYPPASSYVLSNTGSFPLTYDASGRLKTDPVRGITSIGYDNNGLVTSVQTGSSIVRNSYRDGEGNLLRATITENGMNEYDFAARQYVASQMRFTAPDPLAEERPGLSPYIYCNSNPIMLIDPSGKQSISPTGNTANPLNLPVFPDNKPFDWTQGLGNDNTDWLGIGQGENGISLLFDASKDGKSLLDRSVDGANNAAASFGVANGTKDLIIEYAVGSKPAGTLGKYVKVSKGLGGIGGGINAACAVYNISNYIKNGGSATWVIVKYTGDFMVGGAAFVAGVTAIGAGLAGPIIFGAATIYYILDVTTNGFGLDYSPKKQTNK